MISIKMDQLKWVKVIVVAMCLLLCNGMLIASDYCPDSCECKEIPNHRHFGGIQRIADCSHRGLTSTPNMLRFAGVYFDQILLNNNNIDMINKGAFKGLIVNKIDLSRNALSSISDRAFEGLEGLKELHLQHCGLTSSPSALEGLVDLERLDLHSNKIVSLTDTAFSRLTKLQRLNLSQNKPSFVAPFYTFMHLKGLHYLNLSRCELVNMPVEAMKDLSNLTTLILDHNNIESLPTIKLKRVPRLEVIDLSYNPIALDNTRILFDGLKNIKVLKFSQCRLKTFTKKMLEGHMHITELMLKNCGIEKVPPQPFSALKHVTSLDIGGNKFDLDFDLFEGISNNLEVVGMGGFGLTLFPMDLIKRLRRVHTVYLDDNQIKLPARAFAGLGRKMDIYMQRNGLTSSDIDNKIFEAAPRPLTLDLQENDILDLEFITQDPCQFIGVVLDVSNNNITCDCEVFRMVQKKIFHLRGACMSPEKYKDKYLLYSPISRPPSNYFEKLALVPCRGQDRSSKRYECTCDAGIWVNYESPKVCAVIGGTPKTLSNMGLLAFILLLWITL